MVDEDLEDRIARLRGLLGHAEPAGEDAPSDADDAAEAPADDVAPPRPDLAEQVEVAATDPGAPDEPAPVEVARHGTTPLDDEARSVAQAVLGGFLRSILEEPDDDAED